MQYGQPNMINSGMYQSHPMGISPASGIIGSPNRLNTSYLSGSNGIINDGVNGNLMNQSYANPMGNMHGSNYGSMYGNGMGYGPVNGMGMNPMYNALGSLIPNHNTGMNPVHTALGGLIPNHNAGINPVHTALGGLINGNTGVHPAQTPLGALLNSHKTGVQPVQTPFGTLLNSNTGHQPVYNALGQLINNPGGFHGAQSGFHGQNAMNNALMGLIPQNNHVLPSGQSVQLNHSYNPLTNSIDPTHMSMNYSRYSPEELNLFEMRRQAILKKKKRRNNQMCGLLPCVRDDGKTHVIGPDGKSYTKSEKPGCFGLIGGGETRKADTYHYEKDDRPVPAKKGCFRSMLDNSPCAPN